MFFMQVGLFGRVPSNSHRIPGIPTFEKKHHHSNLLIIQELASFAVRKKQEKLKNPRPSKLLNMLNAKFFSSIFSFDCRSLERVSLTPLQLFLATR